MLRSEAVTRIQDGLGFATRMSDRIVLRLREAQRDLENGKTLPKLLLREFQPLTLPIGAALVALPTDFLRPDDDNLLHYIGSVGERPTYVPWARDLNAANKLFMSLEAGAPVVAYLAKTVIVFFRPADREYVFNWSYYSRGAALTVDIENEWLEESRGAPEWLIGEAGYRIAKDMRDKDAMTLFDGLRTQGRAACFGELLAREESIGPLYMGESL